MHSDTDHEQPPHGIARVPASLVTSILEMATALAATQRDESAAANSHSAAVMGAQQALTEAFGHALTGALAVRIQQRRLTDLKAELLAPDAATTRSTLGNSRNG